MHADQNEDENVFSSGGAILDALAENDPSFQPKKDEKKKAPAKKSAKTSKAAQKGKPKKKVEQKKEESTADGEDKQNLPYGITQSDIFGSSSAGSDSSSGDSSQSQGTQSLADTGSTAAKEAASTAYPHVQESDKQNFMDNIVQTTLTKSTGLVDGLQGKSKRKLNSYE